MSKREKWREKSPECFCKFMQTHEWMRRQQQTRNGNRGEDRFRPRFLLFAVQLLKIARYIYTHTDCVYTHCAACTRHMTVGEKVAAVCRAEVSGDRHNTGSPALFAFPVPAEEEDKRPLLTSILLKQRIWNCPSWDWHSLCAAVGAAQHAHLERMQWACFGDELLMNYGRPLRAWFPLGKSSCRNWMYKALAKHISDISFQLLQHNHFQKNKKSMFDSFASLHLHVFQFWLAEI